MSSRPFSDAKDAPAIVAIVTSQDARIAGATVTAAFETNDRPTFVRGITDDAGFAFLQLPMAALGARTRLIVRAPSMAPSTAVVARLPDGVTEQTIELKRSCRLTVVVVDKAGHAIVNQPVKVEPFDGAFDDHVGGPQLLPDAAADRPRGYF